MLSEDKSFNSVSKFKDAFFYSNETYIHPTAIVENSVKIGNNVKIGPFCIVIGDVKIGDGTKLYSNVVIGFPAQNIGTKESLSKIEIGQNCELREFVTIHASKKLDGLTKIGDQCYIMCYSHISHDTTLEDNVTIINNVHLGGHTYIEKNAIIMACVATHQFCRIGMFTLVAPFSATRQDLPPFCLFNEQPATYSGLNIVGLKRAGFHSKDINSLKHVTKLFYNQKLTLNQIKELSKKESDWGENRYVQYFMNFIEKSSRGISKRSIIDRKNLPQ